MLAIRASGKLYEKIDELFKDAIPMEMLEEIKENIQLSAAEANRKPKKTNIYPIRTVPIPFEGQALTEGRKAIRNLVKNREISDLKLSF